MGKRFSIPGYVMFSIFFCLCLLITGLVTDLVRTKKSLKGLETLAGDLGTAVQEKENNIADYEDILSETESSYSELEQEYIKAVDILEKNQLLLARSELLERDGGNEFVETDVFKKIVYLTFDDGPSARTLDILDVLDRYGIKATFFVTYHKDSAEKGMYKLITDKGHSIGNHTYDHAYPNDDWEVFLDSLFKMEDFIFEQTGVRTRIIRFPGGSKDSWKYSPEYIENVQELIDLGYLYFDWNVTNHDADANLGYIEADRMFDLVKLESGQQDKIMILMHDRGSKYSTVQVLDELIDHFSSRGYVFLPITEHSFRPQHFSLEEDVFLEDDKN